jgi:AbrB family looped-hinge helix DNA binding protein
MIQLEAKVGGRGQAVIPKPIRDQMGIHAGDKVSFRIEEGRIVVEKVDPEELLEELFGAYEKRELAEDVDWDREHGARYEERFGRARREE